MDGRADAAGTEPFVLPLSVAGRCLSVDRVRRQGGSLSPAHLAAQGASGGTGAGVCPAVRNVDEGGGFRRDFDQLRHVLAQSHMGNLYAAAGRGYDGAGRCAGTVFRESQTHSGLFFSVTDRIYSGRHRHVRAAGRRKCGSSQRDTAAYGQSFPD